MAEAPRFVGSRGKPSPSILVTNDDGVTSPGLHALMAAMRELGAVSMVAPETEHSAIGHAITTATPLRVNEFSLGGKTNGLSANATPSDCAKIALVTHLEQLPD